MASTEDDRAKDDWRLVTNPVERRRRQNRLNQREYRKRRLHQTQVVRRSPDVPETDELQILENFTAAAYQSYSLGCPHSDHLLSLTKANVYRAFLSNLTLIGLVAEGICEADVLSPFNLFGAAQFITNIPPSLRPTTSQRSLLHHPWLDFFPHPRARDNLIRAQGTYNKHDFCLDILGFWNPDALDNMLLVWGEPHDPANWEVTEGFIKKWGWS
ncbi:hypothetical protein PENFLA_c064G07914 [Penicillium flavigenum]|uniref:BZIP domain-containing protein n=1 Tax=Penicillium flavigenum TaxID=254877 RepID=A0A1V6SG42_9EURO|nr:hypothetical protein PENFLA_c064G07914 [Penicillium flavigenum]